MLNRSHAMSGTRTYRSWLAMWERCTNPNRNNFARYGAVGISVCPRWESFEAFLSDMGERPAGRTLDRKKNTLGYTPENCRWATPKQQTHNSSQTKLSDDDVLAIKKLRATGLTLAKIAVRFGVGRSHIGNICAGRARVS